MNRGVLQNSPVQQMMAATGNPNWWNINTMRPPSTHHHHHQQHPLSSSSPNFLPPPNTNSYPQFAPNNSTTSSTTSDSSTTNPNNNLPSWLDNQEHLPESWSQLLMGGIGDGEQKGNMMMSHNNFQGGNKKVIENWEEQLLAVKQEHNNSVANFVYAHTPSDEFQAISKLLNNQAHQMMANSSTSSPRSCVTANFSSNMLDFSNKPDHQAVTRSVPAPNRSSECNSTANGGALKKARVNQASSTQTTFKVRKEKLGDRITALHQLVSPFGKTDTASVLLEAIGYIRFLQSQIEALSLPYLGSGSGNMRQQQQSVNGEMNCMFPEDPGQLLNDNCMKRVGASAQQENSVDEARKDLRSRGLCLVPVSCTLQVGSDNGADYWAPALSGFR